MRKQNGSAYTFIVIALVLILSAVLSLVFINNFTKQDRASRVPNPNDETELKTYTSISGSGLTFDYPSSWSFEEPTKQQISREDSKATIMTLYSHKPSIVDGKGSTPTSNVCVTFNEMQGDWPFRSQPLNNSNKIADFSVGRNTVSLVESKSNLEASVSPAMQLVNQDVANKHGGAYIALNNEYFLLASAAKDCWIANDAKQMDVTKEIEQAREILKSVRIKE